MRIRVIAVIGLVGSLWIAPTRVSAQGTVMNWTVDGVKREALVFAPSSKSTNAPLVFAFHGHGGTMQGASQQMHIQTVWPEALVVYPQGLNTANDLDPQGTKPGWQGTAGTNGDRDLKFFDAMLADFEKKFCVDEARVYTTGFSNGAAFSYLLWAERAKPLAAIGEVAGRLHDPEKLTEARALLAVAGKKDTVDPFSEQMDTIDNKARPVDQATGPGQPCGQGCTFFASPIHTPVKRFIHPGGHVYPPWAPGQIVKFFKAHKNSTSSGSTSSPGCSSGKSASKDCEPCVCPDGFKAGPESCDLTPACEHICEGHGDR